MAPLTFTVPEVASKYVAQVETDRRITRLGKYAGPLSGVSLAAADDMATSKSNLLQLKSGAPAAPPLKTPPPSTSGSSGQ